MNEAIKHTDGLDVSEAVKKDLIERAKQDALKQAADKANAVPPEKTV